MAYMSQERKAEIQKALKPILAKYQIKASLSVKHHSTIVLTVSESPIDFIGNYNELADKRGREQYRAEKYMDVNVFWYKEQHSGRALEFLSEVMPILNNGNHDRSDSRSDYFDVGWYVNINIGKWDKNYNLISKAA